MRKRRGVTKDDVARWIAQGCGQGAGKTYRPFFKVRDVPSKGRSRIFLGLKFARKHHYVSDIEYLCHLLVEFCPNVIDIREQFALLPWKETQEIARGLGYRHPTYPCSSTPTVVTSDLVVTYLKDGKPHLLVISVKRSLKIGWNDDDTLNIAESLSSREEERTIEKLLIEKRYWDKLGIPWFLVTQQNIPLMRAENIDFIRVGMVSRELDHLNARIQDFRLAFLDCWSPERDLTDILSRIAGRFNLSENHCFHLFGRAVWLRILPVDMSGCKLDYPLPVRLLSDDEMIAKQNLRRLPFRI